MPRFATIALSALGVLGLLAAGSLIAQDQPTPETSTPPTQEKSAETKSTPVETQTPTPSTGDPAAPLPAEVQAKLDAARKAVAEAIVAAEKAGLVQSNVNPPPILDILITGKATDKSELTAAVGKPDEVVGLLSPEAFGAYFTDYAKMEGIVPQTNVRIREPSEGLKAFYDQRASVMAPYLEAARKAAPAPTPEAPPATTPETPPAEAPTAPETPPAEAPTAPETPPAEEPTAPEAPPAEAPATPEAPPAEAPTAPETPPAEAPTAPEAPPAEAPATPEAPPAEESPSEPGR